MDLDAYSTAHAAEWDRLAQLSAIRHLSGAEADELIEHYQSGASQLSAIRTTVGDSIPGDRLSLLLSRARLRFTGAPANPLGLIAGYFVLSLPAALFRIRWLTLVLAAATFLLALVQGWWIAHDPQALAALSGGDPNSLRTYADQDFVGYYSASSEAGFTSQVWTNNAWLAAQCIMFGITGLYVPVVLFSTSQQLGFSAAIMNEFGHLDKFFLYIAPHGQLELYSVFTAAAGGLLIFWSWIAPGSRTRSRALAENGRAFFTIVGGVALALLVSGLIEGVVTRQEWPWAIKIGIGTVALGAFIVYQWVWGRRAYRAGQTGDLEEFDAGAREIVDA